MYVATNGNIEDLHFFGFGGHVSAQCDLGALFSRQLSQLLEFLALETVEALGHVKN